MGHPAAARLALALLLAAPLSGCGLIQTEEKSPGIGSGTDQLKKSPCACVDIEQRYPPGWRDAFRRRLAG